MRFQKLTFLTLILVLSSPLSAQYYFGQNKIQYTRFDWQVLTTEHFEIYFYPEEKEIVDIAAYLAEEDFHELEASFNHHISKKIPLIIYSSPSYFSQTNVIPNLLPENVAGFTEFFKGRVVIPFNGSYDDFAHVIKHELVHVFTLDKISYVTKAHRKLRPAAMPLWFSEGLAEYYSGKWDSEADMILTDMALTARLVNLDNIHRISGTYAMYKVGQSICIFLAERYGPEKISFLLDNWWKGDSFAQIVEITYGKSLKELLEEWEYAQKKEYYPLLASADLPSKNSSQLTFDGFNVEPVSYERTTSVGSKEWIVFKANKLGYSGIYLMPTGGEKQKLERVIRGESSAAFESLHLLSSGIDVSTEGILVFASKVREKDIFYFFDLNHNQIIQKVGFDSLVSLSSPSWSPEGNKIVFSGTGKRGQRDLFIYDLKSGKLSRLTNDFYLDADPTFSPLREEIVFVSNRGDWGARGHTNLFSYSLEAGEISPLVVGSERCSSPRFSPSGDLLTFASDREGVSNIYLLDLRDATALKEARLTSVATGAFDPTFSLSESQVIFSSFSAGRFQIYKRAIELDSLEFLPHRPVESYADWQPPVLSGEKRKGTVKYENRFSLDLAQSIIGYDAAFGPVGGLQVALTDMLGDHQYYFLLSNTADTKKNFFSSFNLAVTYLNKGRRLNWGVGAYHFFDEFYNDLQGIYAHRQYGGVGLLSFPLSRYERLDNSFYLRRLEKEFYFLEETLGGMVATDYVSFVKDNSLWDPTGPIDGMRLNLTVGYGYDLSKGRPYNRLLLVDFRKYFRLSKYSCLANRMMYITSGGIDPQRFYLGGSWTFRGYKRRSFYGRNLVLINNELRYPLINNLLIGLPVGNIGFQAIRGTLFFDCGNAWDETFEQLYGSFGFGARVNIGAFTVLRFDFAKTTNFRSISSGLNFEFFFGWNY